MLPVSWAMAQTSGKPAKHGTEFAPKKAAAPDNSCAVYGAGFVKIAGTETCMKIGGAVSIGAGISNGSR